MVYLIGFIRGAVLVVRKHLETRGLHLKKGVHNMVTSHSGIGFSEYPLFTEMTTFGSSSDYTQISTNIMLNLLLKLVGL